MAEESVKTEEVVVVAVTDVPEAEKDTAPPPLSTEETKNVVESGPFKEETNVVDELPHPQKLALDEIKKLVRQGLQKHDFTEPPVVEEVVKEEAVMCESEVDVGSSEGVVVDKVETVEAIQETVVVEASPEPLTPPPPPEEVSLWGIPLLADERSDVILLKFLRARDFKVKEAFAMLKSVVAWRKEFGIEELLDQDFGSEVKKAVFMHGVDKEGHPVCYNAFGEFSNKELYQNTFADEVKRTKFLRWRIQFLEKSIRKLDFSPDGISTIVQVNDLKNSPGFFAKELRQATNQALQLLQDNYPEFVAKQVVVNASWWYLAFYKMISPFFTQRSKSKFVFVGPSKSTETLFKYIAPEQVPVEFGGLSRQGEEEFGSGEAVTEEMIKAACKHTIEIPVTETCVSVWEAKVVGWDVSYGAEFVPVEGYTIMVEKARKVGFSDEAVMCGRYKCSEPGKLILTLDNQTSKKKKVLYRSKTKAAE
ncbi:Patellin-3 [Heracleum sosnowskyi]|uniref:Patellin-3 n=1 Tax=Heracleum sosnowskyi TaxID=360622 RepID=A0AAD8IH47_9APIA|nr:Patellin-3 [Heracleum sosnowskyi]